MEMASVLFLIACYMVIGLIFSIYYSSDNVEEWGSEFFYGLIGEWCEKNNVSYSLTMAFFSMVCWPVYIITMAHSIIWVICMMVSMLTVETFKLSKALKNTVLCK